MATKKSAPKKKAAGRKAPARRAANKSAPAKRLDRIQPIEDMPPLTDQAFRFAQEYMIDCNAAQAAIRAGYSRASARQRAYELMQDPRVQQLIEEARAQLAEEFQLERETIARELAALGFANMGDYIEVGDDGEPRIRFANLSPAQRRAIQEVTIEVPEKGPRRIKLKLHDKRAALVDLAKLLGYHREIHLHGMAPSNDGTPIQPWIIQPVAPAPGAGPR